MKLFSSKRAQAEPTEETMYPIFALGIAFAVILLHLLAVIAGLRQGTFFEEGFLERDLANTIDSLYTSPGNIMIDYDKNTKKFSFIFDENSVNAYGVVDTLLPDSNIYHFTPDKKIFYSPMQIAPVFNPQDREQPAEWIDLRFAKIDKRLRINKMESLIPNLNELECPGIENAQRFTESPSKGFNDVSAINDIAEMNYARNYNVFVWYYPGSYEDTTKNTLKAFISSEINLKENRRLACLIVNALLDKLQRVSDESNLRDITGVAIIPTDSWQMLNQPNYLAVLLEIGNKNIPSQENLWSNENAKNAILEAIDLGVKSYG